MRRARRPAALARVVGKRLVKLRTRHPMRWHRAVRAALLATPKRVWAAALLRVSDTTLERWCRLAPSLERGIVRRRGRPTFDCVRG